MVVFTVGCNIDSILSHVRLAWAGADPENHVPEDCGETTETLVRTIDVEGNPDGTREIAAERHRRLQVANDLSLDQLQQTYDGLDGLDSITLEQRSENPCDLVIIFHVTHLGADHPTLIDGVPVIYRFTTGTETTVQ